MKNKKLIGLITCAAAFLSVTAIPAWGAEGWQQDSAQQWVYMEHDKKLVNQWLPWSDGTMRYVGGNGQIVTDNWVSAGDDRYRVKSDGSRYENEWFSLVSQPSLPSADSVTSWYYAGEDGIILKNGWYELDGKSYFFYPGGNSPRKSFFNLEDKRYYVDEEGARKAPGWFSIDSVNNKGVSYTNWYYVTEDGSLLRDGWHELEGITCYFDSNGNAYRSRWFNLGDDRYYVDENGARQSGWFSITGTSSNGQEYINWYRADSNGVLWRNGWREEDGKWYFFDANGLNYRRRWYIDGNGDRYYLDKDGILQNNGWFKIENTNSIGVVSESWYYASESGAVLKEGFKELKGRKYYFDVNGLNYRKRWLTKENGKKRYIGEEGYLYQNQWFVIRGIDSRNSDYNYWYYAGNDGYVRMDGWYKIDGQYYCFNTSGVMLTGWLTETAEDDEDEDSYYYCGKDGARVTGWQWLEIPQSWMDNSDVADYVQEHGQYAYFYFNKSTGSKKRSSGGKKEVKVDGVTYCFDGNGIMYPGWVKLSSTTPEIKGYRYFYQPESKQDKAFIEGERVEGIWLKLDGPSDINSSGQKEWYYFDRSGKPTCGDENSYTVEKIQDGYYVFDMYGAAQYGLIEVKGEFYYCKGPRDDRKCVIGKTMVDDGIGSTPAQYFFDLKGKGITGIKDGCFYYKGKLQKADSAAKYEVFDIPGEGKRLINSSGKIMKNTKVTDGNDQKWILGSGGRILNYGSDEVAEILAPEATVSY
ncbi:hypothetical protein [Enterocloster clostridioformis]|uniref:hypothetical protein n=1 Tax=Enterocloster clostridioformis TaxID=1531 RepID=UPI0004236415|nr:hypothetical protein [Enterocloster clostridioformis]